jgi:hypothetical protein
MTFGFSRDDSDKFLKPYVEQKILFFQSRELWQAFVEDEQVHLLGYVAEKQEVTQWIR